jgi:hypothetical protein
LFLLRHGFVDRRWAERAGDRTSRGEPTAQKNSPELRCLERQELLIPPVRCTDIGPPFYWRKCLQIADGATESAFVILINNKQRRDSAAVLVLQIETIQRISLQRFEILVNSDCEVGLSRFGSVSVLCGGNTQLSPNPYQKPNQTPRTCLLVALEYTELKELRVHELTYNRQPQTGI